MEKELELAPIFKALGDATRLQIIEMLSCGELCACDILESFEITQPTLSYHMKILTESNLVLGRKEGAWIRYTNNVPLIEQVKGFWEQISTDSEDCICKKKKEGSQCE